MEEAPPNKSDAATRKRRSSILKSQRAPRTPFSDLEFNVATPTDTAKSRRVSFSRRTGVAEFATNEATTTWKNFYEEHNKSLESSGNDSGANGSRQIASLGRRSFFDKQFQEVEGVDFIETLNPRNPNFNTSVSHINFSNQLSGLDCTEGDKNLEAPEHFDFGSITNHQTNVFEDDIGMAIMGEVSGRIDLNFSMVQTIGSKDKDDLEQLQKDIQQGSSNRNCPTSSQDGKDLSEYIEFDLDVTRVPIQDVSDMSITDTILSPKVQNVSKNNSVLQKSQGNADWVADKENIVLNPYAAPREADNFAINEESDKVLVFDGKKLTLQNTNTSTIENVVKEPQRKTIVLNMHDDLPNFVDEVSVVKQLAHKFDNNETLADDISNISMSQSVPTNIITEQVYEKRKTILFNDGNISVTQSLPAQVLIPEEFNVYDEKTNKTISNEDCDISMTQAVVKNVILTQGTVKSKRNTILFDNNSGDISMTQVLPANLIFEAPTSDDGKTGRRKTIVYDENSGDISCTQVIPTNIIVQPPNLESTSNNSDKTIMKSCLLEETLIGNIKNQPKDSEKAQSTKRKTIVFYDDAADISVTQAIPTNILNAKDSENFGRRKTIVYDESSGDISCTQVIPTNIILPEHNRKSTTINTVQTNLENEVLEQLLIENKINNFTDPNSLKLDKENDQSSKRKTIVFEDDAADISVTQAIPTNILNTETVENAGRRKTIVYDEASGDISCTQVIPSHIILPQTNNLNTENVENAGRRKTIVYDEASGDISCTQVIPSHIILPQTNNLNTETVENAGRRKTIVYDEASGDISCTQVIPSHIILPQTNNLNTENVENASRRKTIVYDEASGDISCTQVIPSHIILPQTNNLNTETVENAGRRKTIVYDEASGDISCTQVIPSHIILPQTNNLNTETVENAGRRKTIVYDEASGDISCTQVIPSHIILPQTNNLNTENVENAGRRKTIMYDEASGDISCTQVISSHTILPPTNMDTNTYNTEMPKSYVLEETCIGKSNEKENEQSGKRKTIVFEDEFANISVTQAIPTNIFTAKSTTRKTILFDQDVGDMSVTPGKLTYLISNKSLDATKVAHCQDVNKSHISALEMSLKIKPKSLDVQEFQMETGKETDDSFMHINKSVHSVSLQKEDFSKTQDVLDQISAIIDCSDAKQPRENSEILNATKNLPSKSIRMISNSTLDQEPKSDVIINKTSQNTSIYNLSINLENISSKKISLSQENAVDPHNVISKSDVIQLVSVSQSCEENPVLTSTESVQKMSSAYGTSKSSTSLISANIKTDLTMTSLDKKKSMLNELLDMSNDSMDYVPKSINKSKNISQSVQSYINIGDDSFDIDKEATELPKDTSTSNKDNIILIPGENIVSVIKEQDNVIIPKLETPDPLETDDFIGFKRESTEEQVTVDRKPDVVNVTENEIISLDNTYKKAQEISVLNMHNDVTKEDPLSKSKENNIADGSLANMRDCTDEVKDEKMDLNSNASKVPSVTMNEKSAMDIVVEEKRPSYSCRITREDFLNNLSIAQQILQNTNLDLDTSMNDDSTECSIEEMDDTDEFLEVGNRTNNEVVKKLDFEDDSSEFENKSDVSSSLHKPSTSQLAQDLESKSIAIPPYSSLGSEDIKDPMNDLVELTADSVPIERNENIWEYASRMSTIPEREDTMCSDQIQANLVSQIDVDTEICFDSESANNVIKVTQSKNKSVSVASVVKIVEDSENDVTGMNESLDNKQPIRQVSPKIIRPDSRTDFSEPNKIAIERDKKPVSKVSLGPSHDKESSFKNESYMLKMPENNQVSMQCGFKSFTDSKDRLQSRNAAEIFSTESKICSLEKVAVAKPQLCEMKDTMVNTILVNKDLSKTSASISVDDVQSCGNSIDMVIDDVLDDMESQKSAVNSKAKKRFYSPRTKNSFGVDKSSPNQSSKMIKISNSPHTSNAEKSKSKDSESAIFSSADICVLEKSAQDNDDYNAEIIETSQNNSSSYATKTNRVYHSSFRKSRHNSVGANSVSFPVTSPEANDAIDVDMILKKESDLASPISRTKENKNVECPNEENAIKTGTNMTAQNVSTDCIRQNDVLEPHTHIESSEKTVETKNDKTVGDKSIRADTPDTIRSRTSKISSSEVASDDLKCTVLSEHKEHIALASKRIVKSKARDDGALNVVPQIEKLPDIGSRKFSWEAHNDAWSFSLLYGRLRLCVRLQRNSDNEPKSYVRADTPIEEVNLDIPYQDTSNSISSTCANFTANTIRHIISRGTWDCASSVPNLLKKCLERVRVGFNWARALHEAWYTMAYKLHDDNKLSVSVANVPLSSVWNVTMRFELVVPEDGEVPWPKAVDVVVNEVVSDVKITKSQIADLLDGLPNDWSHVPRALWKVYDYLGNLKKREEMEWRAVFKHIHKTRV